MKCIAFYHFLAVTGKTNTNMIKTCVGIADLPLGEVMLATTLIWKFDVCVFQGVCTNSCFLDELTDFVSANQATSQPCPYMQVWPERGYMSDRGFDTDPCCYPCLQLGLSLCCVASAACLTLMRLSSVPPSCSIAQRIFVDSMEMRRE